MKKRTIIIFAIVGMFLIIGLLAGVKTLQIMKMIDNGKKFVPPPETVTSVNVKKESWESSLTSVGTLNAVQGVTVVAELPGKVAGITFEAGSAVRKGDVLLRQDTSSEQAQLPGAVSQVTQSRASLKRAAKLFAEGIISQADYDVAVSSSAQSVALAETIRATIAKKTIRAPFSGRLGIRQANLGQYLRDGDPVVTLQALDPIFVDFTIPQQHMAELRRGLKVKITSDALKGETLEGTINAINPQVDADTRNVKVQATINNRAEKLRPGMFVNVFVGLPVKTAVLVIPATSVLYAPYGESVFVIEDAKDTKTAKAPKIGKTVRQQFVRLGEKRGDFVAVTSGINDGDVIASTGVFKLRNGQPVLIDNKLAPNFQQTPKPENN